MSCKQNEPCHDLPTMPSLSDFDSWLAHPPVSSAFKFLVWVSGLSLSFENLGLQSLEYSKFIVFTSSLVVNLSRILYSQYLESLKVYYSKKRLNFGRYLYLLFQIQWRVSNIAIGNYSKPGFFRARHILSSNSNQPLYVFIPLTCVYGCLWVCMCICLVCLSPFLFPCISFLVHQSNHPNPKWRLPRALYIT